MLPRQTGPSLFPRDIYQLRPEIRDPHRYNPGTIARRNGLAGMGFDFTGDIAGSGGDPYMAAANVATDFIGSLFNRKSPGQIAFDTGRQQLWESYGNLLGTANPYLAPQVPVTVATYSQMAGWIAQVQRLMQGMEQLKSQALASGVDPAWIAPRFSDYYNAFKSTLDAWTPILNSLRPTGVFDSISNFIFGTDPNAGIPAPVYHGDTDPDIYGTVHNQAAAGSSWILPVAILGGLFLMTRKSRSF